MANQEHLDILKQGVEVWNQWRRKHPGTKPDLREVELRRGRLSGFDFTRADFSGADLSGADFFITHADEIPDKKGVNIKYLRPYRSKADITHLYASIIYREARIFVPFGTCLSGASFSKAKLSYTNLNRANLSEADLSEADLSGADLTGADLKGANLNRATAGETKFNDLDLRLTRGLETMKHESPSSIGVDTIIRSGGNIPETFLRGVGVPDNFITYARSLIGKPIDYYSCFISYSSKDDAFAKRLYADLQSNNVRCWFAPENLKIGDHYHQRIDESIRLYDKLILILSEHAVQSAWVEREVVAAREKEDREQRQVLFPIRLDNSVMDTTKAWAADVRRRWHIGDFTQWKDHDTYQKAFERLLRDLKTETKPKD